MKKIISIFIIVLISIGIADLIKGVILTLTYTPDFSHRTSSLEMANLLQNTISAITVTIALWSVYKVKKVIQSSKSSGENIVKSYAFKQFLCIIVLFIFAFIVDYYFQNVNMGIESVTLKPSDYVCSNFNTSLCM